MPNTCYIGIYETGEFWVNYKDAAKDLDVYPCNLMSHLSGKRILQKLEGLTLYKEYIPECVKCGSLLTGDNWEYYHRENHCYICKNCANKYALKQYYKNKDGVKLKYRYGITREKYNELLNTQNGTCGICKKSVLILGLSLYIDHDHVTGRVRGLLCRKCNAGLGYFDDNTSNLMQAVIYLKG